MSKSDAIRLRSRSLNLIDVERYAADVEHCGLRARHRNETWRKMAESKPEPIQKPSRIVEAAFFSYGFRPFFLGASVYAAFAMSLWLAWIAIHASNASLAWISIASAPHVWHAHEMVFGFGLAALAGFLLTAVPNWTGAIPLANQPLKILFALWVAGRLAMLLSAFLPSAVVATIDLAFIPVLGLHVSHQLFVRPQPRNMIFLALLAALFIANVSFHLGAAHVINADPTIGLRAGVLILTIVIVIVGGRIVPSFTHNYLQRSAPSVRPPLRSAPLDRSALIATLIFVVSALFPPNETVVALAAGAAALANGARLAGWRGIATLRSPIVAVLHVGYLWIVIGLFVWCVAAGTDLISEISALHALSTGAIGTMVLAVMSRASLGHTGRPLLAPPPITLSYALVSLSALLRTFGIAIAPAHYNTVMLVSGLLWITAYTLFAVVYFPILTNPRPTDTTRPA